MKNNQILKIITIFAFIFIGFLEVKPVYAACPTRGTPGTIATNAIFTGNECNWGKNQFNKNKTCIGTTGNKYIVYYCDKDECEQTYDEPGPNAPALCNRPETGVQSDISKIFGLIEPPSSIHQFGFGAQGIGQFFSNLISLIYIIATLILIFMILWGAFDWMTSEGDKEKLQGAQKKIINAIIGIMLFAMAFAVIKVLGIFTGFEFFVGQNPPKIGP